MYNRGGATESQVGERINGAASCLHGADEMMQVNFYSPTQLHTHSPYGKRNGAEKTVCKREDRLSPLQKDSWSEDFQRAH